MKKAWRKLQTLKTNYFVSRRTYSLAGCSSAAPASASDQHNKIKHQALLIKSSLYQHSIVNSFLQLF
jgi:hypothetical protein